MLSTSTAILVAVIIPVAILLVSLFLSLICFVCRRTIGKTISIIGFVEMMGFFLFTVTINYIEYQVPYEARIIIVFQGLLTILAGAVTVVSTKPTKAQKDLQKITENQV
jgi:hypothetical protein